MSTFNESKHRRNHAGTYGAGRFAEKAQAAPSVSLAAVRPPVCDDDGTAWEAGTDRYGDNLVSDVDGISIKVANIDGDLPHLTIVDHRGGQPVALARDECESVDAAKARGKELRESALKYEHNRLEIGVPSPWGPIENLTVLAPGIDDVWTSSHGGYRLSEQRQAEVDPGWRHESSWYEESEAWSIAAITHHRDLTKIRFTEAHEIARRHYPDQYEEIVGKDPERYGLTECRPITAAESNIVAEREFLAPRAQTHDRMVRLDLDPEGHPGMVSVVLSDIPDDGRVNDGRPLNPRTVLIPADEWKETAPSWHEHRTLPKVEGRTTVLQAS